jgi:prepilin-type processing-associated H-X9-DG protein
MSGEVGGGYKPWADPSNARAVAGSLTPGPTTFGNPSGQGAYMLFADGSVRWLSSDIDPTALNALGTPGGGEPVDY